MARILIIEDEALLAESLCKGLREECHCVDQAFDGEEGLRAARSGVYELIVLDLMLPKLGGMEVCRRLRRAGRDTPILMLTARDTTADIVAGLDAGANDYLTKPFAFEEFLARVRALLRVLSSARSALLTAGPLSLNVATKRVLLDGKEVELTAKEYQLLEALMRHQGAVLSKDRLSEVLWERDAEPESNVLEVYVAGLRRKIERNSPGKLIRTVRGLGYILQWRARP